MESETVVALDDLKLLLGLDDDNSDALLGLIIRSTVQMSRFKLGLKVSESFPGALNYIPLEVCVKRFNRLKNEGMASYAQEGETITFSANDFDEFQADIDDWKDHNGKSARTLGKAMFVDPYRRGSDGHEV